MLFGKHDSRAEENGDETEEKGAQEEEVKAGRKGETKVRWASGDWGRHKIRQRQKGCIPA